MSLKLNRKYGDLAAGGVRQPPPVRRGDRVGVAALSGPVSSEALERGVDVLREIGFEPCLARNLRSSSCMPHSAHSLFAGTDSERLNGFHELVADPDVAAIFFARGGHGVLRLLPYIDWGKVLRRPRAYVGYSDLTPLLFEISKRSGYSTCHGPMVAVDLARGLLEEEEGSLVAALESRDSFTFDVVPLTRPRPDAIRGVLLGGCLSMLVATLGTEFAPQLLDDTILFIEDVGEPLYRLDRMLTQLSLAGCLRAVRALVVGHIAPSPENQLQEEAWHELLLEVARRDDLAVAWGLRCGHRAPNLTIPIGLDARLDLEAGLLEILG